MKTNVGNTLTRPRMRRSDLLAWWLLSGWLAASGLVLGSHMLDNPPGVCATRSA